MHVYARVEMAGHLDRRELTSDRDSVHGMLDPSCRSCVWICVKMCIDMCVDMHLDMCVDTGTRVQCAQCV